MLGNMQGEREEHRMNELTVFQNDQFGEIRIFMDEKKKPWFCGKDVLAALEYSKSSTPAVIYNAVPDQWKGIKRIGTLGGEQNMLCLSEQGLYFFLGRSDKPKATPYQMFIAGEVMPSIRKHGVYMLQTQRQQVRIAGITIRRSLTDAIKLSGENERMHGQAFSTFTNLVYKTALGKNTKQLQKEYGCKHPRDVMPAEELEKAAAVERIVVDMLMIGLRYQQIKPLLEQMTVAPLFPAA